MRTILSEEFRKGGAKYTLSARKEHGQRWKPVKRKHTKEKRTVHCRLLGKTKAAGGAVDRGPLARQDQLCLEGDEEIGRIFSRRMKIEVTLMVQKHTQVKRIREGWLEGG